MPFGQSQFAGDRRSFQADHRGFNPPPSHNHLPPPHGSDMVGVAPTSIRGGDFRPSYDSDMPPYLPSPSDLNGNGSRALEDPLRQMNLLPRPMGSSSDMLTFIRYVVGVYHYAKYS